MVCEMGSLVSLNYLWCAKYGTQMDQFFNSCQIGPLTIVLIVREDLHQPSNCIHINQ